MTPNTPGKIKAFYAEEADAGQDAGADKAAAETAATAAGAAAVDQRSSVGGRASAAGSSSAYEVLQFQQPAEPEQQVSLDGKATFSGYIDNL
jgi:hypothetical protein